MVNDELTYEPQPVVVYRARWRHVIPVSAIFVAAGFLFMGIGAIAFRAGHGGAFSGGFAAAGAVAVAAGCLHVIRAWRSQVGCNRNGITYRGVATVRHVPFTTILGCTLNESADVPVHVVLQDGTRVPLYGLTDCLPAERAAFVEAVNRGARQRYGLP